MARRSKLCKPPALSCQEALATLVKEPHNQSESLMQNQKTYTQQELEERREEKSGEKRRGEEGSWEVSNGKGNGNGLDAHEVVCGTKEP